MRLFKCSDIRRKETDRKSKNNYIKNGATRKNAENLSKIPTRMVGNPQFKSSFLNFDSFHMLQKSNNTLIYIFCAEQISFAIYY